MCIVKRIQSQYMTSNYTMYNRGIYGPRSLTLLICLLSSSAVPGSASRKDARENETFFDVCRYIQRI